MANVASLGAGAPAGSLGSIAATPNAAAVGDFVLVAFCWAIAGKILGTVTDTSGNTWNVKSTPASASESGGYAWTIVTTGWASAANTVTGTLSAGATGGGRCWQASSIAAALNPVVDQEATPAQATTNAPSITSAALAQASESVIMTDVCRASAGTATLTATGPAGVYAPGFQAGSGSPASGCGVIAFDNTVGTAAVTMTGGSTNAGDVHGIGLIAVKTSTAISVTAPVAVFDATGQTPTALEAASAPAASVPAVGVTPGGVTERAQMAAPAGVAVTGQTPIVPGPPPSSGDRGPWYRPVIESDEDWLPWRRQ